MGKTCKLVLGVGVNDADYQIYESVVTTDANGKKKRKDVWICPFYLKWKHMLQRCYSVKFQERQPTYSGCSVCEEWLTFSNFKVWMETQDWEGKQLDKDLLFSGNKVYSPDTCVFIGRRINTFLVESKASRGEWIIGVYWHQDRNKFVAQCNDGSGQQKHLGSFNTEIEAHQAWLAFKLEQAKILAAEQTDTRVAKALIERYSNYAAITNAGSATGGVVSSTFKW